MTIKTKASKSLLSIRVPVQDRNWATCKRKWFSTLPQNNPSVQLRLCYSLGVSSVDKLHLSIITVYSSGNWCHMITDDVICLCHAFVNSDTDSVDEDVIPVSYRDIFQKRLKSNSEVFPLECLKKAAGYGLHTQYWSWHTHCLTNDTCSFQCLYHTNHRYAMQRVIYTVSKCARGHSLKYVFRSGQMVLLFFLRNVCLSQLVWWLIFKWNPGKLWLDKNGSLKKVCRKLVHTMSVWIETDCGALNSTYIQPYTDAYYSSRV